MHRIREAIVVEGRYDKNTLSLLKFIALCVQEELKN